MNKLLWRYLDPAEEGAAGGDALDNAIENASAPDAPAPDASAAPAADAKAAAPKFAWGNEDRRKTAAEIREEQELDLGYEEEKEGKKVPAKYTIKQIREQAKWLHENRATVDFGRSIATQFKNNPEWGKMFDIIQAKMFEGGKFNNEFVTKQIAALEGKVEQVKEAIEDKTDDIKEMETLLLELDPESPQGKIMKSNINGLKATRAQLAQALQSNKDLMAKVEDVTKFKGDFEEKQKKETEAKEDARVVSLIETELASLTAKEKTDGYHIEDADDRNDFDRLVDQNILGATKDDQVKTDEQFVQIIRQSAKAAFETISKRNERIIMAHLQKKQPPKQGQKEVSRETKVPEKQGLDMIDDLVDKAHAEVTG